MERDRKRLDRIEAAVMSIIARLDKAGFYDYIAYMNDKKAVIRRSLISGIFRGAGMAIGFSLLGAIIIHILNVAADSSIPYIANFISEILKIINAK